MPQWLRLHVLVRLEDDDCGAVLVDFVPLNPTSKDTLVSLLAGRSVPGEIRVRRLRDVADNVIDSERLRLSEEFLKEISSSYDNRLNLYSNNCLNFALFCREKYFDRFPSYS
jgi:hypothetical protein